MSREIGNDALREIIVMVTHPEKMRGWLGTPMCNQVYEILIKHKVITRRIRKVIVFYDAATTNLEIIDGRPVRTPAFRLIIKSAGGSQIYDCKIRHEKLNEIFGREVE